MDYDEEHDVFYVSRRSRSYSHSEPVENVIFDIDEDGSLVGIEILDASEFFGVGRDVLRSFESVSFSFRSFEDRLRFSVEFSYELKDRLRERSISIERMRPHELASDLSFAIAA